jgi:hypothetical protein
MQDFTLYLHEIDPTRFGLALSRHKTHEFAVEWRSAWAAYYEHIQSAHSWVPKALSEFALSSWRQDLRDPRCIRKKELQDFCFQAVEGGLRVSIWNPILGRELTIVYADIQEFCWRKNQPDSQARIKGREVFYDEPYVLSVEEMRFDTDKTIEHELRFICGTQAIIRAKSCSLNLSNYLAENE